MPPDEVRAREIIRKALDEIDKLGYAVGIVEDQFTWEMASGKKPVPLTVIKKPEEVSDEH